MALGAGMGAETNKRNFLRLSYSPFKQELVGNNSLEGNELVFLDIAAGVLKDGHKVFLDQFDLLRILNLKTLPVAVVDENRLSWKLRFGVDRVGAYEKARYEGTGNFGAGRAWKWNEHIIGYALIDLTGHTIPPYARLRPHAGFKFDLGNLLFEVLLLSLKIRIL